MKTKLISQELLQLNSRTTIAFVHIMLNEEIMGYTLAAGTQETA